jgi:hypothetical protein
MKPKIERSDSALILKDSTGKTRIAIIGDSDFPYIRIYGQNGASLVMEVAEQIPRITLNRPGGKAGLLISVSSQGSVIVQYDNDQHPAIWTRVGEDTGMAEIALFSGGQIASISQTPTTGPVAERNRAKSKPKSIRKKS